MGTHGCKFLVQTTEELVLDIGDSKDDSLDISLVDEDVSDCQAVELSLDRVEQDRRSGVYPLCDDLCSRSLANHDQGVV